jgi:glycosyltransferase involved in cell wall biosynthesis
MNILITSPSLDMRKNVNGISAVVSVIMANSGHRFVHYRLGRYDGPQGKLGWLLGLLRQLAGFPVFLLRHRIHLVHQNFPFDAKGILREVVVTAMARLLRVPVMLHVHGGEFLMQRCRNRLMWRLAVFMLSHSKAVVVLSDVEKEALARNYGITGAQVLSNAVEIPDRTEPRSPAPSGKRTLLFLGRIHESKGVEDLVVAFQKLYPTHPFRLVVCGAGPLEEYFVGACRELMGHDFEFAGVVSGEAKQAILDRSDIFVLPSRYGEGLPMALLETMANGVVPVVTDDASMKIVVKPSFNGLRVQKRDPDDLAAKLQSLLVDDSLLERLSQEAQRTIRRDYSIGAYTTALEAIYELCVDGGALSSARS